MVLKHTDKEREVFDTTGHWYGPDDKEARAAEEHAEFGIEEGRYSPTPWVGCAHCGHRYDGFGHHVKSGSWAARQTYFRKHLQKKHDLTWREAYDAARGVWDNLEVAANMAAWRMDAEQFLDQLEEYRGVDDPFKRSRFRWLQDTAEKLGIREAVSPLRRAHLGAVDYDGYEDEPVEELVAEAIETIEDALSPFGGA